MATRKTPRPTTQAATTNAAAPKATAAKPKGWSLHIGLNSVDPGHYGGWSGDLTACEFDALDMAELAKSQSIKPTLLLTRSGTRAKVLAALRKAAKTLKAGDLFLLSYSGHGGQVTDIDADEPDGQDETWCLFDSQLIDDELYYELSRFAAGVRILVLSDSCHSGSVVREAVPGAAPAGPRPRLMPPAIARRTYREHKAFYDGLQKEVARAAGGVSNDPDAVLAGLSVGSARLNAVVTTFKPSVILISGCQDNQTSMDGEHNGAFTERLLAVWRQGAFQGSHRLFHQTIRSGMPSTQSPNLFTLGPVTAFVKQRPFKV